MFIYLTGIWFGNEIKQHPGKSQRPIYSYVTMFVLIFEYKLIHCCILLKHLSVLTPISVNQHSRAIVSADFLSGFKIMSLSSKANR